MSRMWHSGIEEAKAELEAMEAGRKVLDVDMDINMLNLDVQQVAADHPQCFGDREFIKGITPSEVSVAIQEFGLEPKMKWSAPTQQSFHEPPKTFQYVPVNKMSDPVPEKIARQDSGPIVDKQRGAKRLAPPELDIPEAATPGVVQQLGVRKKIAQKRMLETEDDERMEIDKALQSHMGELNIGFREPVKPAPPNSFQTRAKNAVGQLVKEINSAWLSSSPQSFAPRSIIVDPTLTVSDLDVSLRLDPEVIGGGTFGDVTSFKTCRGHKIIQKELKGEKGKSLLHRNEFDVPMSFPDCSFITRVFGLSWDGQKAFIFQENAGLSLRDLMQMPQHQHHRDLLQQPQKTMDIIHSLLRGLQVLHNHGIRHRDVKPENFCWDPETGQARLIDFASSRTPQDEDEENLGGTTPEYLPPIVSRCLLTKKKPPALTEKSDVWAAGMVGLYIIKGGHPVIMHFAGMKEYPLSGGMQIRLGEVLPKVAQLTDPLPDFFLDHPDRPELEELLRGCLAVNEGKRWTAEQAVSFLQGKLNTEPMRKHRKFSPTSKVKMEAAVNKATPHSKVDDQVIRESFNVKLCQASGVAEVGGGFMLKTQVPGPAAFISHQLPPRPQLVHAMTQSARPIMPSKIAPPPAWQADSETEDEDLAWLQETCGVKKATPGLNQQLRILKAKQAKQAPGFTASTQFGTAMLEEGRAQGKSSLAIGDYKARPNLSFTAGANGIPAHSLFGAVGRPVLSSQSARKERKVMSPLPDSPEPPMIKGSPLPKSQVVGMWGQVSPLPQQDTIVRSRIQALKGDPEQVQGNIPNFLDGLFD